MESNIIITPKRLLVILAFFITYIYLCDKFNKKEFQELAKQKLQKLTGNNFTNHTIIEMIENHSNAGAALISMGTIGLLSNLPV